MEPITRKEKYLDAILNGKSCDIVPITREEQYLFTIANGTDINVAPYTRTEQLLSDWSKSYKQIVLQDKTITENGTYTADEGYDGLGSVTVEVAGAGGGSLPAGGYWYSEYSIKPYSSKESRVFVYKGKRYWYGMSAYNDNSYDIYLYENNVYTLVAENIYTNPLNYAKIVEYNEKIHFIGDDHTRHLTWDGVSSTFETCANLPYTTSCFAFVIDGDLYIKTKDNGFYKWLEDSDTWEFVEVANCPNTTYEGMVVSGRKIYIVGYAKLYEVNWDTKTCETIATDLPKSAGVDSVVVLNGNLYFMSSSSYNNVVCGVYKYNLSERNYTFLTGAHTELRLYVYDNHIYGTSKDRFNAIFYEVTE